MLDPLSDPLITAQSFPTKLVMSSTFKCEICHNHPAKLQYFDPKGKELYICKDCFDSISGDFFRDAYAKLKECEERFKKIENIATNDQLRQHLANRFARVLLAVKTKLPDSAKGFTLKAADDNSSIKIDAEYDSEHKRILFTTEIDSDDPGKNIWTIDLSNPNKTGISAIAHCGNEHCDQEHEYRFTLETIPQAYWNFVLLIIESIAQSIDDLEIH